ncbi:GLECT [Musa troglodytarum]|uniref:GLECT n=1 Tax=Musa troglodytarum TaxID=320322 RepID=A0A9E7K1R2_9LILI|nr:GLECT [Musa troglodytarum]
MQEEDVLEMACLGQVIATSLNWSSFDGWLTTGRGRRSRVLRQHKTSNKVPSLTFDLLLRILGDASERFKDRK